MCGICGIISEINLKKKVSLDDIKIINKYISNRGPDGNASWLNLDRNIGISIHRLSTQGANKNSNQPCFSEDGKIISIMNGEIYNYKKLRNELIKKGYSFKTNNDTEVVSNAYHYWGRKFLTKLEGQFAIFTYNQKKKIGILARDEHGISPLFYAKKGKKFYFSSTEDSLNYQINQKIELDKKTVSDFIISGSSTKNRTIFKNIKQLQPGNFLTIDDKNKISIAESFKKFNLKSKYKKKNIKIIKKKIFNNLYQKVTERSSGDKKVGIFLSGGIDSTLILALFKKKFPQKKIITFTAVFQNSNNKQIIGEHKIVKKICKYFNCKNILVPIKSNNLIKSLGSFSSPESGILEYCNRSLAKVAKKNGVNVIMSGEGSDEMFLGYDHNLSIIGLINKKFSFLLNKYKLRSSVNFNKKKIKIEDLFLIGGADINLERSRKKLFNPILQRTESLKKTVSSYIKKYRLKNPKNVDKIPFLLDYEIKIPNIQLRRSEGPAMNEGVEMRFPFLNNELKTIVYNCPLKEKINKSLKDKFLLRETFKDLMPNFLSTEKMPFGVPATRIDYFSKSKVKFKDPPLKNIFYLNHRKIKKDLKLFKKNMNFFKKNYIKGLLKNQQNSKSCFFDPILWRLWSLAKWYKLKLIEMSKIQLINLK